MNDAHNSRSDGSRSAGDTGFRAAADELEAVPQGAFALAGAAVALLLIAWLLVYAFIFLQRGPVG